MNEGAVAKWQGKGLQNPHRRFDSAPRLHKSQRRLTTGDTQARNTQEKQLTLACTRIA